MSGSLENLPLHAGMTVFCDEKSDHFFDFCPKTIKNKEILVKYIFFRKNFQERPCVVPEGESHFHLQLTNSRMKMILERMIIKLYKFELLAKIRIIYAQAAKALVISH
jgi:hypothetical protein